MILHDLPAREALWNHQQGQCAVLKNPIDLDCGMLHREGNQTRVVGWLGGLATVPEIQEEAAAADYKNLFQVVHWCYRDKATAEPYFQNVNDPELRDWVEGIRGGWWTVLAWSAWSWLMEPSCSMVDRLLAFKVLRTMETGIVARPRKHRGEAWKDVVWPAQWSRLIRPGGMTEGYAFEAHQFQLYGKPFGSLEELLQMAVVKLVRETMDYPGMDQVLFDGDGAWKALAVPVDLRLAPFFPANEPDPVVKNLEEEPRTVVHVLFEERDQRNGFDHLAYSVGSMVERTLQAHQVDAEKAWEHASWVAFGACFALADHLGMTFPQDEKNVIWEGMEKPRWSTEEIAKWRLLYREALQGTPPRPAETPHWMG